MKYNIKLTTSQILSPKRNLFLKFEAKNYIRQLKSGT